MIFEQQRDEIPCSKPCKDPTAPENPMWVRRVGMPRCNVPGVSDDVYIDVSKRGRTRAWRVNIAFRPMQRANHSTPTPHVFPDDDVYCPSQASRVFARHCSATTRDGG
jgi:hypothetical protein